MAKRKHFINEKYFETVETEKQAYILGFIYSDGCVQELPTTSALTFSQLEQDVDILYKIKEELQSDYPMFNSIQKLNKKTGKYEPDMFCAEVCGQRRNCPNSIAR